MERDESKRPITVADLNIEVNEGDKKKGASGIVVAAIVVVAILAIIIAVFLGQSCHSNQTANKNGESITDQAHNGAVVSATNDDYVLPDSADRFYDREELESMDLYDLFIARNEIFARHGRGFKSTELQSYFDSQSWYTKEYEPDEFDAMPSPLNDCERENANLILEVEKANGSPYI